MPQFTHEPGTGPTDHCNSGLTDYRQRCLHDGDCLTAYGRALLEAFRHANQGVLFTEDNNPCFGIIATGSIRRHYPCEGFSFGIGSILIDHEGAARVEKNAAVYIPQPYYTAAYSGFDGEKAVQELAGRIGRSECLRKRLSGLTLEILYAGAGRSWYYPGNSALWIIGKPEALATINTDYPVPQLPEVLTVGRRKSIKTTLAQFDAPTPCPRWKIELPDWTCQYVNNRGNVCGKTTGHNSDRCQRHSAHTLRL